MKKFIAKLIGWREQRNPSKFVQQGAIEMAKAEENRQTAMGYERERLRDQMKKREEPSEAEILGPSDSADKK